MSEENVEVVRRTYARWAHGDLQAGIDLFDPEIVFESFTPDRTDRIVVTGRAEIAAFMEEFLSQWRDYRLFADEFHDAGDVVFVTGHRLPSGGTAGSRSRTRCAPSGPSEGGRWSTCSSTATGRKPSRPRAFRSNRRSAQPQPVLLPQLEHV